MVFDCILLGITAFAVYTGWKRGALSALAGTLGMYLAILIALRFSNGFAEFLQSIFGWKKAVPGFIAFLLTAIACILGVGLLVRLATRTLDITLLGPVNRALGAILSAGTVLYILSNLIWYANVAGLFSDTLPTESTSFSYILKMGPAIHALTAYLIPLAHDIHAQIQGS